METTRQQKISRLIQKELSDMFQKETQSFRGVLVSVSAVRISPDLSVARGYLSIFPSERAEEILKNINTNARTLEAAAELLKRGANNAEINLKFFRKISPARMKLEGMIYSGMSYLDHIDALLAEGGSSEKSPAAPTEE